VESPQHQAIQAITRRCLTLISRLPISSRQLYQTRSIQHTFVDVLYKLRDDKRSRAQDVAKKLIKDWDLQVKETN